MSNLINKSIWKSLKKQAKKLDDSCYSNHNFNIELGNLSLHFNQQKLNQKIFDNLIELAESCQLKKKIQEMISGYCINQSQNQPALHIALRTKDLKPILIGNHNILEDIALVKAKMRDISEKIRQGLWLGSTGHPITDIVHIGIGGSDLGPQFFIHSLHDYILKKLSFHFVSNGDSISWQQTVAELNPETTLVICVSKSFTTEETLLNTKKALAWMHGLDKKNHFIAVTEKTDKAKKLGITHVLPIWPWVGGRYSVCSAVNLITAIAIGWSNFELILEGAYEVDQHFIHTDFDKNIPVVLGMLGIWNSNFLHINNLLILTYSNYLCLFMNYVQQLDMESNGKSIDNDGNIIKYETGPIIWGGSANQAQHSYYQWICQGQYKTTIDFITIENQSHCLMNDYYHKIERFLSEKQNDSLKINRVPLNHIELKNYSPKSIGMLVAIYEHKVFTQGVLWNINSFDQPGIELLKKFFYKKN